MKNVKATKLVFFLLLIFGALYQVLPTFVSADSPLSKWLPANKIKLGLDLQGGIQMVLGVDLDKALANEADRYVEDLRTFMGNEKIVFSRVYRPVDESTVSIQLLGTEGKEPLLSYIREKFNVLELNRQRDNDLTFNFNIEAATKRQVERDTINQALETIRNRIDEFGVNEPQITTQGRDRIVIQLPGIVDPARARELIGKTAQLEFRLVDETLGERELLRLVENAKEELRKEDNGKDAAATYDGWAYRKQLEMINQHLLGQLPESASVFLGKEEGEQGEQVLSRPYLLQNRVLMTGEKLDDARVSTGGDFNQPVVNLRFNPQGARTFEKITTEHTKKMMAIVLDGRVNSAPQISVPIRDGRAQITLGGFQDRQKILADARDLVVVLRAGALPAPVEILENRAVGPSLGKDSVRMGKNSLLIGALLVVFFMLLAYRRAGIVADVVLTINLLFILAVLAMFQATLTLPGIAGLVLTVGMAVDANIIIFERIREELGRDSTMIEAVRTGFAKAHLTILDANITTLIAGFVLLQYGTGPVKGFAVTLIVGVVTSYITALWMARYIFIGLLKGQSEPSHLFVAKRS